MYDNCGGGGKGWSHVTCMIIVGGKGWSHVTCMIIVCGGDWVGSHCFGGMVTSTVGIRDGCTCAKSYRIKTPTHATHKVSGQQQICNIIIVTAITIIDNNTSVIMVIIK